MEFEIKHDENGWFAVPETEGADTYSCLLNLCTDGVIRNYFNRCAEGRKKSLYSFNTKEDVKAAIDSFNNCNNPDERAVI